MVHGSSFLSGESLYFPCQFEYLVEYLLVHRINIYASNSYLLCFAVFG